MWYFIAFEAGAIFGVVIMSLMFTASKADKDNEKIMKGDGNNV